MELYLVNYRHKDSEPFKSITDLPLEKAKKLAERLYKSSSCKDHRRKKASVVFYVASLGRAFRCLWGTL